MSKHKVVVCDHIHKCGLDILENAQNIEYVDASDINKTKLLDVIKDAKVVITRSSTCIDEKFLNATKKLKAIIRAGVGYDNVDIQSCSKRGIIAMNIPTANTIAAVELTLAHMLNCVRKFPYAHNQLKQQKIWNRENWYGTELYGKKLGIIGFGNIGHKVALRAKAFTMEVITYDPYINSTKATDLNIEYTKNFDDILACDIITIHTPKNRETVNIIDENEISKMRDGVVLINCARGGLYNEKALYNNLKSGKIAMAGIDVFVKEPADKNPLLELDNIIVTAHLGANTKESQIQISQQAAKNAIEAVNSIAYPNALNLPIDESKIPFFVKQYIELIQKMAFLIAQSDKNPIRSISICAEGKIADYIDKIDTFAYVGALCACCDEDINYINVPFIAKDKNIKLNTTTASNKSGYENRICIELVTHKGVNTICGTIFNDDIQRVVQINGYKLDIEPKGNMILIKNSDIPGVIGDIGTILGSSGINISDFRLSRKKDSALAVILVDESISSNLLQKIGDIEATSCVSYVEI